MAAPSNVIIGNALYKMGKGFFQVEPDSYLTLNDPQHYAINIESPAKVTSFILFFKRELAADVYQNLLTTSELLLEQPTANHLPHFFERTYVWTFLQRLCSENWTW